MLTDKSQFELRHVLYCDLLGFSRYSQSEYFEEAKCFRLFTHLDELIDEASKHIDPSVPEPITGLKPDYVINPEAIYCSDSIVISTPATNIDAIWLCEAAARIQNGICAHGFLLRGAIATGKLYHSGNTLFGPAICKAVELDKSGNAPVIIIADETLNIFCQANSDEDKEIVNIRKYQLISEEDNNTPFIDPFWLAKIHTNQEFVSASTHINIDCWRNLIESGMRNKDTNILGKYAWMARRFNRVLCNKVSQIKPILLPSED